jgi:hypothetical protein
VKLSITAESQEEFDLKRESLIKKIASDKFDVILKARPRGIYNKEKGHTFPRDPHYKAQAEMLAYWDGKFKTMLSEIKGEIGEIIGEK